jgi:hypothetical protein
MEKKQLPVCPNCGIQLILKKNDPVKNELYFTCNCNGYLIGKLIPEKETIIFDWKEGESIDAL